MAQKHGIPSGDDSTCSTFVAQQPEADQTSSQKSDKSETTEIIHHAFGSAESAPNKAAAFTSSREFLDASHGVTVVEPEPHLVVKQLHRSIVSSFASKKFNKALLECIGETFSEIQKQQCCQINERKAQCQTMLEIWTTQASGDRPRLVTDLIQLIEDMKAHSTDNYSMFDEIIEKLRISLGHDNS